MHKKQITFIFNNIIGGIATMNFGIIKQAQLCKYFDIRVILITKESQNQNTINVDEKNLDIQIFNYSDIDNYYFVLKTLKKLIDQKTGYLVTNDGLELDCIKYLGTNQVVLNIVHDLYNLKVALNYSDIIDFFICHTVEISSLLRSDPNSNKHVYYLPYGVEIPNNLKKNNNTLKIVSLSRLVEGKGVLNLIKIENELFQMGIKVEWLILGDGPSKSDLLIQWKNNKNVIFQQPNNEELKQILSDADIFISLSEFEGYGISLLEAMSYGLVPIITKLPIGIHSLLPSDCGMILDELDFHKIARFISQLNFNNSILRRFQEKSKDFVLESYSSAITGQGYLDLFKLELSKKTNGCKMKEISNFGFLDSKTIPNVFSRNLKRMKKYVLNKSTIFKK